jgi:hypothetical protein
MDVWHEGWFKGVMSASTERNSGSGADLKVHSLIWWTRIDNGDSILWPLLCCRDELSFASSDNRFNVHMSETMGLVMTPIPRRVPQTPVLRQH